MATSRVSKCVAALVVTVAVCGCVLAVHAAGKALLVASFEGNRVFRYDASTGAFVDVFIPEGSGGINGSCCLTFGPDGNLYVTSVLTASVLRYDGATGNFIDTFVPMGSGGLPLPVGIILGPDDNLYVASVGTSSVLRYDGTTGAFMDAFVPTGSGGLFGLRILAFTPSITICHRPPGNPEEEKTINIGQLSVGNHLAHGDSLGACHVD